LKIYFPVLCYYPSQAGGPANTIFWLNEELAKVGYSCLVTSTMFGLENNYSVNQRAYNPANKVKFVANTLGFFRSSELKKLLEAEVIHFSSLFFRPTLPLIILGIVLRKKVALSPRGELYPEALQKSKWIKSFYLLIFRWFSSRIQFHATNEVEKSLIESHFRRKRGISTIPNYISIENLRPVKQKKQVLFLGRINEIKNIHLLIRAV
jgi:glycosyltransferase involved in cell wall biosynthesis